MEDKIVDTQEELNEKTLDIVKQLIVENDMSKVRDLTQLFNAAHIKKQVLRSMTYDNLLDHITEQMTERITQRGDQFSNKDLLDYANSVTTSLEKAQKQITGIDDIPVIQVNQQNNTLIMDSLDSESQRRVENAIKSILEKIKKEPKLQECSEDFSVQQDDDDNGFEDNSSFTNINFNKEED